MMSKEADAAPQAGDDSSRETGWRAAGMINTHSAGISFRRRVVRIGGGLNLHTDHLIQLPCFPS